MTATFDLSPYKCTSPPETLWRVIHPRSQSGEDPVNGDLIASDSNGRISNKSSLKQVAEEHFDWYSRQRSCFLSAFGRESHARNWADRLRKRTTGTFYIYEIDRTRLPPSTYIFKAESLVASLNITHEFPDDEFIFLHRIPRESLTRMWYWKYTWRFVDIDEKKLEFANMLPVLPTHGQNVLDAYEWSDGDDEYEEHNRSDDTINMIEGG